jgi:LPXTG-motif cell wall-anchored protein
MAPKPAAEPAGMSTMTWLLIAIAIAAVLFFFLRRKKEA